MTTLPVLDAPPSGRRPAAPPRHLADLDLAGRRAAVAALGEREFRAGQLSTHYFGRLVRDPDAMTDVPVAARGRLAAARPARCSGGCTTARWWRAC